MVKFHEKLSDRSVYYRYFAPLKLELDAAKEHYHKALERFPAFPYARYNLACAFAPPGDAMADPGVPRGATAARSAVGPGSDTPPV